MIPSAFITEWKGHVPWADDSHVEQDLVISRSLVEIFGHPTLASQIAFRGGTALYKLYLLPAARYSEDIDLVQITSAPIGPVLDLLRERLDFWLGNPKRSRSEGRVTLLYSFQSETTPPTRMRLKVEINSREHFSVYGFEQRPFQVSSRWFSGDAAIQTYTLDELLGTKLRALYQRRKGRDLFDIWLGLTVGKANPEKIITTFLKYTTHQGLKISKKEFLLNLEKKAELSEFMEDIRVILAPGFDYDSEAALKLVRQRLISLL
jgi:predicted nucleotidyltransferase component of viral defense system